MYNRSFYICMDSNHHLLPLHEENERNDDDVDVDVVDVVAALEREIDSMRSFDHPKRFDLLQLDNNKEISSIWMRG